MCFFEKQCRERKNENIDQRAVTSCVTACLFWGWISMCLSAYFLGVVLSFGVHPSLAVVGSTSQRVGQCLFRPLDHAGVELGVTTGMLCEVIAPHEALLTEWTAELLFPSVGPVVAGQLI